MKSAWFTTLLLIMVLDISVAQSKAELAFTLPEKDLIPEGITYDPVSRNFFIGSIHKRKVVSVSPDGKVSDYKPSLNAGLNVVLGMTVHDQKLWVCNNSPEYDSSRFISFVHVFDLKRNVLWKTYRLEDGKKHLFNDITITREGVAYVSDSDGGGIYRIRADSDTVESFLPAGSVRYPNGITLTPDEKKLIFSTGSGLGIVTLDIATKTVTPLQHERFLLIGTDGLYRYGNSLISVQNVTFPESITELRCNEAFTKVLEVVPKAVNLPQFDSPTTGVIVGNEFYFIANSQLLQTIGTKGTLKDAARLKNTIIMRLAL